MNKSQKLFLSLTLVALFLALIYFTISYGTTNVTGKANKLKRQAREAYVKASYKEAFNDLHYLRDSMHVGEHPVELNLAHAGYLLTNDSSAGLMRDLLNNPEGIDSAQRKNRKEELTYAQCVDYYRQLGEIPDDNEIASIAYNQLGVIVYRWRGQDEVEQEEKALAEAAEYFKSALKKDGQNEIARYNYELIRLKMNYHKVVMEQVQSLIKQRKYKEARHSLTKALKKDDLFRKKYADYEQRIENVIRIDSLSRS